MKQFPGISDGQRYLFLSVFLFLGTFLLGESSVSWYVSNGVGMKQKGIIPEEAGNYKWVLKQEISENEENIYLYKDGKEYRHIQRKFNSRGKIISETLYLSGKISEKKNFDSDGDIAEKISYNENGSPETLTKYSYSPPPEKKLISTTVNDKAGNQTELNRFAIRKDGSLRKIVRQKNNGTDSAPLSILGRRRSGSGFTSSYSFVDGISTISLFDRLGRVSKKEQYKGGKLIHTSIWNYKDDTNVKTRCEKNNLETGTKELILYNSKGLVQSEKITVHGIFKSRTEYRYNGNDQIIEKDFKEEERTGRILYLYKGDDLIEESFYRGDELYSKIYYISKKKRIEEKYRNNQPVLKIHYINGVKVLDQFFLDGELIREKRYQ